MKRFFTIFSAVLLVLSAVSCKGNKTADNVNISGEWKLVENNGNGTEGVLPGESVDLNVYIAFSADGIFDTYQQLVDSEKYEHYTGTYTVNGDKATGKYSDGKMWAATYNVRLEGEAKLVMTAGAEICVYEKTNIPAEVKSGAIEAMSLKSSERSERVL